MIGQTLGAYQITGELGAGGFATVYEATHAGLGHRVAIKVLHDAIARRENLRDRFRLEARLLANLDHPHIVRAVDLFEDDKLCAFVLEFVEGMALNDVLAARPAPDWWTPDVARDILVQTLDALDYAHSRPQPIVHRDIKPSNIFVKVVEGRVMAKVMDFGIARIVSGDDNKRMTRTGTLLGTLYYMSPEQIRGVRDIDGRSDLYAAGCVLYELLTGHVPFEADTDFSLMQAHLEQPPRPPLELNPSISLPLQAVVLRALAKDRDARFPSAGAFKEALLAAWPLGAVAPPPAEPTPAPAVNVGLAETIGPRPEPEPEPERRATVVGDAPPAPAQRRAPLTPPTRAEGLSAGPTPLAPAPTPVTAPTPLPAAPMALAEPPPAVRRSPALLIGGVVAGVLVLGGLGAGLVIGLTPDDSGTGRAPVPPVASAPPDPAPGRVKPLPPAPVAPPAPPRRRRTSVAPTLAPSLNIGHGGPRPLHPVAVTASSTLVTERRYMPEHAFDGLASTAWHESVPGNGEGQWLEADFGMPRKLTGVHVVPGFDFRHETFGDLFPLNAHARTIRVTFDGRAPIVRQVGPTERLVALDDLDITAQRVRFTFDAVHPGAKWDDLAISEVRIDGLPIADEPAFPVQPITAAASSAILPKHPPVHAFDGRPETAWNHKGGGNGRGQWLEATFAAPTHLDTIEIDTGYNSVSAKYGDLFEANAHLRKLEISLDGTRRVVEVAYDQRTVTLEGLDTEATTVRFVALEVYPGKRWEDLCVSEVRFWSRP